MKQEALRLETCFVSCIQGRRRMKPSCCLMISALEVMIDEKVKVVETAGRNPEKVIKKCKETQLNKGFGHAVTVVGVFK